MNFVAKSSLTNLKTINFLNLHVHVLSIDMFLGSTSAWLEVEALAEAKPRVMGPFLFPYI